MTVNFSFTPTAEPLSVSVLPSPDVVKLDLYMSLPSLRQVRWKPFIPLLAATQPQPAGHIGPVAGCSLPSNVASQTLPSLPRAMVRPSEPLGVSLRASGE